MEETTNNILVYADWTGIPEPTPVGTLSVSVLRGKEIFAFEYHPEWLKSNRFLFLDPDLSFFSGRQYPPEEKGNFGLFLDSSPDRWGRFLMDRREASRARFERRKARTLLESDYLLGVHDQQRMGGLRFRLAPQGEFLASDEHLLVPPWSSLRDLEFASRQIENDVRRNDRQYDTWLNLLLAPGSSLGGARPKAGVIDTHGSLWIAKFPSQTDTKDMGAWEMIVNQIAARCGIRTAENMLLKFSGRHHTYLSKRFDRGADGERIHYASAMTLLGYRDSDARELGASYLELAELISKISCTIRQDLEEMWTRMVFNICVSNTDDHLRNHGFLLTPKGWRLSPAFDMNPNETGAGLTLNINENDNALNIDLALEVAEYFRLSLKKAKKIILGIKAEIPAWRQLAKKYKIPKSEQEQVSRAFLI